MSREDQYQVSVTLDGASLGVWDMLSGGEIDSEESKYKPGGLKEQISLGGFRTVTNVTVQRLYDLARDHTAAPTVIGRVGKGTVVVTKQPLDVDGNVYGKPIVYKGTLKQYTMPDHDSKSADPGMVQLEVTAAGIVA